MKINLMINQKKSIHRMGYDRQWWSYPISECPKSNAGQGYRLGTGNPNRMLWVGGTHGMAY